MFVVKKCLDANHMCEKFAGKICLKLRNSKDIFNVLMRTLTSRNCYLNTSANVVETCRFPHNTENCKTVKHVANEN